MTTEYPAAARQGEIFLFPSKESRSIQVTTVIGCRNKCSYCPQDAIISSYAKRSRECVMNMDVFKKCADKIPADVPIHFSGFSEPWQNPACADMIAYACKTEHIVDVYTTLAGMMPRDAQRLLSLNIRRLFVHLPSDSGHEQINIDGDYISSLKIIRNSGFPVKYNLHLSEVHPKIKPIVKTAFYMELNTRAGNAQYNSKRSVRRKLGKLECAIDSCLMNYVLLPNGEVALCCMDFGLKHVIGSLLDSDYRSLFAGKEFKRVSEGMAEADSDILCRRCNFAYKKPLVNMGRLSKFYCKMRNIRSARGFAQQIQTFIFNKTSSLKYNQKNRLK